MTSAAVVRRYIRRFAVGGETIPIVVLTTTAAAGWAIRQVLTTPTAFEAARAGWIAYRRSAEGGVVD